MQGSPKMWNIGGDLWDSFDGAGIHEMATLYLDETKIQAVLFTDDAQEGDEHSNF